MKERKPQREADADRRVLERCGIDVVVIADPERWNRYRGELHGFSFERQYHRSYWIVRGRLPIDTARALYEHPVGRTDIRVAAHCGCPPPEYPWVTWYLGDEEVVHDPDGAQERDWDGFEKRNPGLLTGPKPRFERDPAALGAAAFVDLYHVDTELGLYVLAEAIRGMAT